MTDWQVRLPMRSRFDSLADLAANARHLEADDCAVVHELVLVAAQIRVMEIAEHVAMVLEDMSPAERRWALDRLRKRAGLPTTGEVEAHTRWKAADEEARIRMAEQAPRMQVCHAEGCAAVPVDPTTGVVTETNARKWWCEQHRHLAAEGDMEPARLEVRISPSGVFEPIDAIEEEREAVRLANETARRQLEHDQALRERATEQPTPPPFETPANLLVR